MNWHYCGIIKTCASNNDIDFADSCEPLFNETSSELPCKQEDLPQEQDTYEHDELHHKRAV